MGRRTKKIAGVRQYVGIESGLTEVNKSITSVNKARGYRLKCLVERIVERYASDMKKISPAFKNLYTKKFGNGSFYESLNIATPQQFEFNMLFKIPEAAKPKLIPTGESGYVHLKLENGDYLDKEEFKELRLFIDDQNYVLREAFVKKIKKSFMQNLLEISNHLSKNSVKHGKKKLKVTKSTESAFTMTVEGPNIDFKIKLIPCILLNQVHWPQQFRSNPYPSPSDFYIEPGEPEIGNEEKARYWRISFQMQERKIMSNRSWMKPAIRITKCMRDHFNQEVSSYAIKTMFIWKLYEEDKELAISKMSKFWNGPLSYVVITMLEFYIKCLRKGEIQYFWDTKYNLLGNLDETQAENYAKDVEQALDDIKNNCTPETLTKYLKNVV